MIKELSLEARIKAELASYDGLMAVYVNDMKGNILEINADEQFETASQIKVYIMACLYEQVAAGNKSLSDMLEYKQEHFVDGSGIMRSFEIGTKLSVKNVCTLMIIVSDNIATNMLIDYLGIDTINKSILGFGCTHTKLFNSLHFERYEHLGTHTAREYASMFERIINKTLINEWACDEMTSILKQQHYNSTLTKYFPQKLLDEDTRDGELIYVASKSGSFHDARSDGGFVSTPYGKYVIIILTKDFSDPVYYSEHPSTVFGAKVSRLIFDQYLALEGRIAENAENM